MITNIRAAKIPCWLLGIGVSICLWGSSLVFAAAPLTIELYQVNIAGMDLEGVDLRIQLEVENGGERDFTVYEVQYVLAIEGQHVKQDTIRQTETFPRRSQRSVDIPARILYEQNALAILKALRISQPTRYEIQGTLKIRGDAEPIPFSHRGQYPE